MTKRGQTKISRRDAIKILAAAVGATTVANLPPEWSRPDLEVGALPAHAQTSIVTTLLAGPDTDTGECHSDFTSTVAISPVQENIEMRWVISNPGGVIINTPGSSTGTASTDATGVASLFISTNHIYNGTVTITWSFENPADGTGSDAQAFFSSAAC